jgi:hypothetical protein
VSACRPVTSYPSESLGIERCGADLGQADLRTTQRYFAKDDRRKKNSALHIAIELYSAPSRTKGECNSARFFNGAKYSPYRIPLAAENHVRHGSVVSALSVSRGWRDGSLVGEAPFLICGVHAAKREFGREGPGGAVFAACAFVVFDSASAPEWEMPLG